MSIINPHTGKPVEEPKDKGYTEMSAEAEAATREIVAEMERDLKTTEKKRMLAINNFFHLYGPLLPGRMQNISGVLMQFRQDMALVIQKHQGSFKSAIFAGVGRNDPCPCESGEKYKKCCLPKVEELLAESHEDGTITIDIAVDEDDPDAEDRPDGLDGGA